MNNMFGFSDEEWEEIKDVDLGWDDKPHIPRIEIIELTGQDKPKEDGV